MSGKTVREAGAHPHHATLALAVVAAAWFGGCMSRATPSEVWYVDQHDRVYPLVLLVIHDLGGEVVTESRWMRTITARFPEEVFGHGVYLDVTVERRNDESWVRAETRPESAAVAKEDLESLRVRFYEALDALWTDSHEEVTEGEPRPPETHPVRPPR